jgi:hypothetical protein
LNLRFVRNLPQRALGLADSHAGDVATPAKPFS